MRIFFRLIDALLILSCIATAVGLLAMLFGANKLAAIVGCSGLGMLFLIGMSGQALDSLGYFSQRSDGSPIR